MRAKNLTPFQLATKVTSRRPPQPEATVVVKGSFRLGKDGSLTPIEKLSEQHLLSGDVYEDDDDARAGELVYASDFADFKLNAEVLLRGSAYAPRGEAVTELPVLFRVGAFQKALRVIGPRFWSDGLVRAFSEPSPFSSMPLTWQNAFGGPGFAANPVGKGLSTNDLPTVELAGQILRSRGDRPAPAGFGPRSPTWPPRAGKLGKAYGKRWKEERAPFYAEDFDWTHFSAAPADQQLAGYLRGDEEITLQNLHPEAPVLTTRLPDLRVRVFLKDDAARFREVSMSLDTLFVDTDKALLVLTWRGVDPVREDDLSDLMTALVASEPRSEPPQPEAAYRAMLEAFEADPIGLRDKLPPEMRDLLDERPLEDDAPPADPLDALLNKKLGKKLAEKERAQLREALAPLLAKPEVADKLTEALAKAEAEEANVAPTPRTIKPGTLPELSVRRRVRQILEKTAAIKQAFAGKELPPAAEAKIAEVEQIAHHPKWKTIDPDYAPPLEPVSTEEPGPNRDLSEQDWTGRDLRGADLRGANLRWAILTRADLRGANLDGVDLRGATLFKTDLTGASLKGADLTRANAACVVAEKADLSGATIEQTFFEDAKLAGAKLDGAKGEYAIFTRADLTGLRALDATLDHAEIRDARLEGADLRRASLKKANLSASSCRAIDLSDARLAGTTFKEASLDKAKLVGAGCDKCVFEATRLDDADLGYATLRGANLTRCSALRASFYGADLRDARLNRATLEGARFERANLFAADLSKAKLGGVSFRDASLYDAILLGASGAGTDFAGAKLHRSTLERE